MSFKGAKVGKRMKALKHWPLLVVVLLTVMTYCVFTAPAVGR